MTLIGEHEPDPKLAEVLAGYQDQLDEVVRWLTTHHEIMVDITADAAHRVGVDELIVYLDKLPTQLDAIIDTATLLKERVQEVHTSLTGV